MADPTTRRRWPLPAAALGAGALAALPALTGCAGVETANAGEASLERFTSCAALTDYAQSRALEIVGPYGLGGGVVAFAGAAPTALTLEDAAGATRAAAPTPGFSGTNVQEAGIDEPDIVKTDGSRIYALARNRLYAVDASGPRPRVTGSIALPNDGFARDMLLSGNRLMVMSDGPVSVRPLPAASGAGATPEPAVRSIAPVATGSVITQIDVTDPSAMRVLESLQTEARYVTARLSGATARVVLASSPSVFTAFTYPTEPGPAGESAALAANRRLLSRTTADQWLPRYSVTSADGATAPAPLVPCEAVSRPSEFSGLETLTVLTMDLAAGLDPIDTDSVMASGENVYASDRGLYVATNRWPTVGDGAATTDGTTQVHKFETAGTSATTYRGSGAVTGHLLNQFSMSEHEGRLRVATTAFGQTLVGGDAVVSTEGAPESESYVSVLEESGGKLRQIGQVGGLGKGERIYAVRFIGERAYVVTFRQTDPLYTVDLSDPTSPRVAGELKIAGYSAYLHPISDDLLIGVGQDADGEGRTTGLQVSLFDVSDAASPRRLQQGVMPGASSEAEWDHHAFLWWPARSLAVIPFTTYGPVTAVAESPAGTEPAGAIAPAPTGGALAMSVSRERIAETGRVTHPADPQLGVGVRRSLVIGDTLFTVSDGGVRATSLEGFADRGWAPFD